MIDGKNNNVGLAPALAPPTINGEQKRQRVGAAGDGERDQGRIGERCKDPVEFVVGKRSVRSDAGTRRLSSRHWPVRS